jgi:ubiquinone/menaquinone biosynthesis C-methylase UbiE
MVGDARDLQVGDAVADVVLLLGPLYHLTERADRVQALREAYRILKPGGVVIAAAISRFASLMSGLMDDLLKERVFAEIVTRDLQDGQHRNPENHPAYFTTAFFHHPDELKAEALEAGFTVDGPFGVEGPSWMTANLDAYTDDPALWARLLDFMARIETEPTMLGVSSHLLVAGRK